MSETETLEKPNDRLQVTYDGQARELFMSFMRLNNVLRVLDDPTQGVMIAVDPDLNEAALRIVLSPTPTDFMDFVLNEAAISSEDVEKICGWVQDHVLYFFAKRFQQTSERAASLEPILRALQSSDGGSKGSTSPSPSAGPSA